MSLAIITGSALALHPIPTDVLNKFLPEILPFITDMCSLSLQKGNLPPSQRQPLSDHGSRKQA